MYNWSTDERQLAKNKEKHAIWQLEQMVNFGLGGKKLERSKLKKHFNQMEIDPSRKKFLSFLLYGPNNSL